MKQLVLAAVACLVATSAWAQVETVVTHIRSVSAPRVGSQFREDVNQAARVAKTGDVAQAQRLLKPVMAFCDQLRTPDRDAVSVGDATQYEDYVASRGDGVPVEWIDVSCPNAYKMQAFLDVELKNSDSALAHLDRANAIAPYLAEPYAERGYLLNQLGRSPQALDSYRRGLELAERYASNAHVKALMQRGLGYTLIELGDLDGAQAAYTQSLETEPGNRIALSELEHIRQQRARSKPPTTL